MGLCKKAKELKYKTYEKEGKMNKFRRLRKNQETTKKNINKTATIPITI